MKELKNLICFKGYVGKAGERKKEHLEGSYRLDLPTPFSHDTVRRQRDLVRLRIVYHHLDVAVSLQLRGSERSKPKRPCDQKPFFSPVTSVGTPFLERV